MRESILKALALSLPTLCLYCTLSSSGVSAGRPRAWLFSDGAQYLRLMERDTIESEKSEVQATWVGPNFSKSGKGWMTQVDGTTYVHLGFAGEIVSATFFDIPNSCRIGLNLMVNGQDKARLEASCVSL